MVDKIFKYLSEIEKSTKLKQNNEIIDEYQKID